MANARGKTVDTTYLSIDQAEDRGFIHRDYIAHCLRWSHVCKRLSERKSYQTARILDVGCGRELPMAKMLYSSRLIPQMYYGVDAGPIEDEALDAVNKGKFPLLVFEKTNLLDLDRDDIAVDEGSIETRSNYVYPNVVTCFEVLEHVEPEMMLRMLRHLRDITSSDCRLFFSTPCWNQRDCAANHVNEIRYDALGAVFEREGLVVEHVYGTFASIRDYERLLSPCDHVHKSLVSQELFNKLREYYDTNFLSCVFAPLFPAQSRNCLWELRWASDCSKHVSKKFLPVSQLTGQLSSSKRWRDLL